MNLDVPGLIRGLGTPNLPETFISKIPVRFCSDETLNWWSLVNMSMVHYKVSNLWRKCVTLFQTQTHSLFPEMVTLQ